MRVPLPRTDESQPEAPPAAPAREGEAEFGRRTFRLGVAACTTALGAFLLAQLRVSPPHEDELLALVVGGDSVGGTLETVLGERGGAPLHFLLASAVAHAGGGLVELRLVSALAALASVPVVAALGARLAGRTAGLAGTALACAGWVLLFHGVSGRMYSLFLLTSALSYLELLAALARGRRGAWISWGLAALATVATHPYGALVLLSQALYALLVVRARAREALVAFAAVILAGMPLWYSDLVLARRFDVGLGGGGETLGSPVAVAAYLRQVAADFSAGQAPVLAAVLTVAAFGLWRLARVRPHAAVLAVLVLATPALVLTLVRLGASASPESRHLIFALPFFCTILAVGILELTRRLALGPAAAAAALVALCAAQIASAWEKTPQLFTGEARTRIDARRAASAWLAETGRADDLFLGYHPLHLDSDRRPRIVPRADAGLALHALRSLPRPLGRGVWIVDGSPARVVIPLRLPRPRSEYEARSFGPYLVVRSRRRTGTPRQFLEQTAQVMLVAKSLRVADATVNYEAAARALAVLKDGAGAG